MAILLVFLIASPVLIKVGVMTSFYLNQQEIIAEKCINRNKPAQKCHGKCYLAKQLKKADSPCDDTSLPARAAKIWENGLESFFVNVESPGIIALRTLERLGVKSDFCRGTFPEQLVVIPVFKPPT
ncbi:MAG: hypothetical protein EP344_12480 [Bacteroidetes bacterium]|nr:MAG: hypothetical protein EP344_12480 [Bacteroidota bacterium]